MTTLLIIEDEPLLIDMYKIRFEGEGYKVLTANDGEPGFKMAKKYQPDMILLDIIMPKTDGYETLKKLKGDSKTKNLPILVFSNLGQKEEITKGLKLGADDYVVKSKLTPTTLLNKVEKMLGQNKTPSKKVKSKIGKAIKKLEIEPMSKFISGKKVLLIEDNESIIEMYEMRLTKEGMEVEIARNGAWGLRLAKEREFDIILMDLIMPAMDGYEALRVLKKNKKTKDIPILVLSNSAQESDIKKTLNMGADSYFIKSKTTPVEIAEKVIKIFKKSKTKS